MLGERKTAHPSKAKPENAASCLERGGTAHEADKSDALRTRDGNCLILWRDIDAIVVEEN
eukprot:scaffold620_cov282-Pinguiococcus_pyrenoidosus.AAC.6